MKKILLYFCAVFLFTAQFNAQSCTPGANFADSTYGIWPDTSTNFPLAEAGVAYSTDLNFKVPDAVTEDITGGDPALEAIIGSEIQGFTVTSVDGLPAGYDYACNVSGCQYLGGENGCANVFGTTAETGEYPVTITVEGVILVVLFPGLPPTPVTQALSFDGYKIIVGSAGTIEEVIQPLTVIPNPASETISVNGLSAYEASKIAIMNIEGKVVAEKALLNVNAADFDLTALQNGVYFVKVAHANGIETIKFIKQ